MSSDLDVLAERIVNIVHERMLDGGRNPLDNIDLEFAESLQVCDLIGLTRKQLIHVLDAIV